MQGIRIDAESPVDRRESMRVVNNVADELYFRRDMGPHDGEVGLVAGTATAAVIAPQTVAGTPSIDFPATAAGKPAWRSNFRRRDRWRHAGLRMRIIYTATAGAAGNVRFELILRSWSPGDLAAGQTDLGTGFTVASPAVASTFTALDYVNTAATIVPGNKDWMTFFLYRDKTNAADTSAFSVYVTGIELEILPQG